MYIEFEPQVAMFKLGVGNVNLSQTTGEFTVISPFKFKDRNKTFSTI